ncbi:MAG TPA: hypothetical protein VFZ65_20105 [Planctomycetota bacterium]|nr:hypothetical protein [Planctomycetota bacterium]
MATFFGRSLRALAFGALLCARIVPAQCDPAWQPGHGVPGVDSGCSASTLWDPDGPGPRQPLLVVGGGFRTAGAVLTLGVAAFDFATGEWSSVGASVIHSVAAVLTTIDGRLVACGSTILPAVPNQHLVARFDGAAWQVLGSADASVHALVELPNGDLVVGGSFTSIDGVAAACVARWDGASWHALGSGTNQPVTALAVLPNSDLVVGGGFTVAGGVNARRVARWDGNGWHALGAGISGWILLSLDFSWVHALAVLPNGDLVVGGQFLVAGTTPAARVARWDGTSWHAFGAGWNDTVRTLHVDPAGRLIAGGAFTNGIAAWNGSVWTPLGSLVFEGWGFPAEVWTITTLPNGDLVAGGAFHRASTVPVANIARWNGAQWTAMARGFDESIYCVARLANGDVAVGGAFRGAPGVAAERVARFDGAAWRSLGAGVVGGTIDPQQRAVWAIAPLANGGFVVGGNFNTVAGNVPAQYVARWDGTAWSGLGSGVPYRVRTIVELPNGDIVVAGAFTLPSGAPSAAVARWNDTAWQSMGSGMGGPSPYVSSLLVLPNGDLVAAGFFTTAGGVAANSIARWDGAAWHALGAGVTGGVTCMTLMPDGDLIVGGTLSSAGGVPVQQIARWDGAAWHAVGTGLGGDVKALAALPNGDLLVGGEIVGTGNLTPASNLVLWDGASWRTFGSGLGQTGVRPVVIDIEVLPDGDVVVVGAFGLAGGHVSTYFARLTPPCPALVRPIPTACLGSAGPLVLAADTAPWVGATFRSTATGFAPGSMALSLLGYTAPHVPLASLHPLGALRCDLLASADAVLAVVPVAGAASASCPFANDPVFAGLPLYNQFVQVEFDAAGIAAVNSSNGLALTVGVF